jgi:TetR/AcrR family transcriptional repressor of bet genes
MAQAKAVAKPGTRRRSASKEERREQLIKATIKCIARKGLSGTTMADVTSEAGLSLGIINLHFQSKDKLLVATLSYVADEYTEGWNRILGDDTLDSAGKITALIAHDFSASIVNRNKLAIWYAFWGEARSRPTYQKICSESDQQSTASMQVLCSDITTQGGYSRIDADLVATGYTALADGLWLDMLLDPAAMPPERAGAICRNYMHSFFPRHLAL